MLPETSATTFAKCSLFRNRAFVLGATLAAAAMPYVKAAANDFNNLCSACTFGGYNYCHGSGICFESGTYSCSSKVFNAGNPCHTDIWCDVGINGVAYVGSNTDSTGTIDVSASGSRNFSALGSEPCYMALYNYQKKSGLNFEVTGGSVDANLVSISYPNEIT